MPDQEGLTDARLLHDCAAGDRRSCADFVARHEAALWRFARAIAADPVQAEDVLQETFLAALRGGAGFEGDRSARAWLYTIARNRLHRLYRRRAGEPERMEPLDALGVAAGWGEDPEAAMVAAESRVTLARALDALDPADREVLLLRDVEGFSGEQTAAILGVPLPTAKTRLHRARLRLKAALREGGSHGPRS